MPGVLGYALDGPRHLVTIGNRHREEVTMANYTSTVFKQHGDWYGAIRWSEDGKERRKTKKLGGETKTEAKHRLKDWEKSLDEYDLKLTTITLADYIKEYIDRMAQSQSIERATVTRYYESHKMLESYIPEVKLTAINLTQVQKLINDLNQDYHPSTVRKLKFLCGAACKEAVYDGYIKSNPFDRVRMPKLPKSQPNALDTKERDRLKQFLDFGGPSRVNVAATLAMYCGLRVGEICGLKWSDIDFKSNMIWVRRSVGRCKGGYYLKPTKTDKQRDIPLPGSAKTYLMQWRMALLEECSELGVAYSNDCYIVGPIDGGYTNPCYISRAWTNIRKALNLKGVTGEPVRFHDLRHTFATAAIAGGVDVKTVSSILGHANAAMTLNIYASADPNAKKAAGEKLDEII